MGVIRWAALAVLLICAAGVVLWLCDAVSGGYILSAVMAVSGVIAALAAVVAVWRPTKRDATRASRQRVTGLFVSRARQRSFERGGAEQSIVALSARDTDQDIQ